MSKIEINAAELILKGGDERLSLDLFTGLNKYHINPSDCDDIFNRGSCTVNGLTSFSKDVLNTFVQKTETNSFAALRAEQSQRLKALINFEGEDKFDIIYAPSGSDLIYIPYVFSFLKNPEKPIVNFLTCPEELGSGTIIGAEGKYFMRQNQFGEEIPYGEKISEKLETIVVSFSARDERGNILNHKKALKKAIENYGDYSKIGSLVIGSKSGIENNIDVIEELSEIEDIYWAVDLCQFRNRKGLINKLLDLGCMVMITGSKFYQSPPFSGAMLVPKRTVKSITKVKVDSLYGFEKVFSSHDFPQQLSNIQEKLNPHENFGLLARWECAISEMELYNKVPAEKSNALLVDWNKLMCSLLWEDGEYFELMPNMELTNKSIISFRVKKDGKFLDYDRLKKLFENIVNTPCENIDRFTRVFIGQPVKYGDKAFLRLAIGSFNIRKLLDKDESVRFENDKRLIEIIKQRVIEFA